MPMTSVLAPYSSARSPTRQVPVLMRPRVVQGQEYRGTYQGGCASLMCETRMMRTRTLEEAATAAETGRRETLYARHAPDAARLAYLLTGDRALAEDIVQDAFVKMFGRFRDLRHPDAFGAYLRKTVVNLTRSYFRRRGLEHTFLEK